MTRAAVPPPWLCSINTTVLFLVLICKIAKRIFQIDVQLLCYKAQEVGRKTKRNDLPNILMCKK